MPAMIERRRGDIVQLEGETGLLGTL